MRLRSLANVQKFTPGRAAAELLPFTFPAPTGGWNARDPLISMKITDAVALDNFFPTTGDVQLRGGSIAFATGLGGKVETLMTYSSGATNKLFGIAGNSVRDCSAAGAVGAAVISGLTNARWQHVNFTTSGGAFIEAVNGIDSLVIYDGVNWQAVTGVSAPYAITGIATTSLVNVFVYKKRLFFVEKNKLKLWYLAVDSFQGVATAFDLSAQFNKGGYIVSGGALTRDGGDGLGNLFVVISSNGEVLLYQGTDPGTDFILLGRYDIGSPLGYRSIIRFGADLLVMTIDGVIGISKVLTLDRSKQEYFAITDKIRNAFNGTAAIYKNNFGWSGVSYPGGAKLIFNIPLVEGVRFYQYVQNSVTGAWCRFKDWNATSWTLYNDLVYFGGVDGTVYEADVSESDNGAAIFGLSQSAFSHFGRPVYQKHVKLSKFNLITDPGIDYGSSVIVDFESEYHSQQYVLFDSTTSLTLWGSAIWGVSPWSVLVPVHNWKGDENLGTYMSLVLFTQTKNVAIKLNSADVLYTLGGAI